MPLSYKKLDWVIVAAYILLVAFGWLNIYSSSTEEGLAFYDLGTKHGMHLIWIGITFFASAAILFLVPPRIYPGLSLPLYFVVCVLLVAVAFLGVEVNGSKSWFAFGPVRFQPAEFSKISTSLVVAWLLSKYDFSFKLRRSVVAAAAVILVPILFILMEKETGSALVYLGFLLAFYREGMSGWILILGLLTIFFFILTLVTSPFTAMIVLGGVVTLLYAIHTRRFLLSFLIGGVVVTLFAFLPRLLEIEAVANVVPFDHAIVLALLSGVLSLVAIVFALRRKMPHLRNALLGYLLGLCAILSVQFVFDNILQDHQRARIETLLGIKEDPMGVGYNVHQSMIAIGSGGMFGKGFLEGTQTRFDFVPEQSTDFIFCTVGEEWGFAGTLAVLLVYFTLIVKLILSAEKQKNKFTRVYGYCVASCFLMHVFINISMTIGLMPVIGIPLPLLSYGGSSLLTFSMLLFIYLRLDLEQWNNH